MIYAIPRAGSGAYMYVESGGEVSIKREGTQN